MEDELSSQKDTSKDSSSSNKNTSSSNSSNTNNSSIPDKWYHTNIPGHGESNSVNPGFTTTTAKPGWTHTNVH